MIQSLQLTLLVLATVASLVVHGSVSVLRPRDASVNATRFTMKFNPKRGLADKYQECGNWGSTPGLDANAAFSFAYDWGPTDCPNIPASKTVPMIWGTADVKAYATKSLPRGSEALLGFNEPNGQSAIDPTEAAKLWPQVEAIAKRSGISRIGSPAMAGGASASGTKWLRTFLAACKGCKIDFMAIHYYGCSVPGLSDVIATISSIGGGKPVWVTETNCNLAQGPVSKQSDYMRGVIPMLNSNPKVERFSWMCGERGAGPSKAAADLFHTATWNNTHELTELGQLYLSL